MALAQEHCSANPAKLDQIEAEMLATELNDWLIVDTKLEKTFRFKNFHETMAFVNAVAWIAHQEDHHPDLEVTFSRCRIVYTTRSASGISRNDIICAAKVDALLAK
jgi:4a-hydroxytetrahydrobiopterin dehydratase